MSALAAIGLGFADPSWASTVLFDRAPACGWGPGYCSPPYPYTNGLPTVIPDGAPSAFWSPYFTAFTLNKNSQIETVTWVAITAAPSLTFYDDDGHAFSDTPPGDVLQSYALTDANTVTRLIGYAWPDTGNAVYEFTTTLPTAFDALSGPRYWLSIGSGGWARSGGQAGYCIGDANCSPGGRTGSWGSANVRLEGTVPEPASLSMLGAGVLGLIANRRRRTRTLAPIRPV